MIRTWLSRFHNRRPILWTVIAFILAVSTVTVLFIWWNVLLVQNHRILHQMAVAANAAAKDPTKANLTLAILMVLGILCSLVVVTGLLYLFLRLIQAVRLNLAQSHFIASVTHELRSPVAGLQLMLDTIRDPSTPADKRAEFETCMKQDLNRLQELVDQVLETARLENISSRIPLEKITVEPFLRSCVDAVESRSRSSGAQIELKPMSPTLSMTANRPMLGTAVRNILDNAIKYSAGPAEISLHAMATPKSILIEIRDRGIGIKKKEQKRVFRRFYRAGDPIIQNRSGTGLGLYFARMAIKAQGGKISAQSDGLGMGSTFRIEISQ